MKKTLLLVFALLFAITYSQKKEVTTNVLAVLPVPFLNTDSQSYSGEMAKFAQNDIYEELISKLSNIYPLTVQDIRTTNNLLRKAGITHENIDEVEIDELREVLGVDHIIAAKIQFSTELQENTISSVNIKDKNKSISGSEISTKKQETNYLYKIYLDFYKDSTKVYTQKREPYFKMKDSWMDALRYLLKRSPIYHK